MDKFSDKDLHEINIPAISSYFWKNKKYNFNRICKVFLFYRYLYKYKKFTAINRKIQHEIIKNLEAGCYNNILNISLLQNITHSWDEEEFTDMYHIICGRILSYLSIDHASPEKVSEFIDGFIDNIENAKEFPYKTQRDLYPKLFIKAKEKQSIDQNITVKASKLRTCPKCKQKLSTTKNRYARSLDEGTDLTATCVFCGFSWGC